MTASIVLIPYRLSDLQVDSDCTVTVKEKQEHNITKIKIKNIIINQNRE